MASLRTVITAMRPSVCIVTSPTAAVRDVTFLFLISFVFVLISWSRFRWRRFPLVNGLASPGEAGTANLHDGPIALVAAGLGHADVSFTLRIYVDAQPGLTDPR